MPTLSESLQHWPRDSFAATLKRELEQLPAGTLPLQQCLTQGSHVDEANLEISVLTVDETERYIRARLGVFFTEIIANCSCGDEPVAQSAYGLLQVNLDKASGQAQFLVPDD